MQRAPACLSLSSDLLPVLTCQEEESGKERWKRQTGTERTKKIRSLREIRSLRMVRREKDKRRERLGERKTRREAEEGERREG